MVDSCSDTRSTLPAPPRRKNSGPWHLPALAPRPPAVPLLNASRSAHVCHAPRESAPAADRPAPRQPIRATLPPSLTSETPPDLGPHGTAGFSLRGVTVKVLATERIRWPSYLASNFPWCHASVMKCHFNCRRCVLS